MELNLILWFYSFIYELWLEYTFVLWKKGCKFMTKFGLYMKRKINRKLILWFLGFIYELWMKQIFNLWKFLVYTRIIKVNRIQFYEFLGLFMDYD